MSVLENNMLALGSCIAGFGILLTALLAVLFRNPGAPRWTRPEVVAMLVCVPVTVTTGLGLGYTAHGVSQLMKGAGDPRELLVLAAVVIALAFAWRALGIRRRLKAYAAAAPSTFPASGPTLLIDREPPPELPAPAAGARRTLA